MNKTEPFLLTTKDKVFRALQMVELDCLKEFDRICRKHNIEYSLGGGTCLGRFRHGGFIPWDDDIDIDMTVEDYDRFMEVAPGEIDDSRFFLRCKATDPNHYRTAAKLEAKGTLLEAGGWVNAKIPAGIFIDISRANYLPDEPRLRHKVAHKLFMIHGVQNHRMLGGITKALRDNFSPFWWFISEFMPIKSIIKWEDRLIDKYGRQKSGWLLPDTLAIGDFDGYPSVGTDEYEDVEFEDVTVRDKKNPENFLGTIYKGPYWEWLPPIKRISHHKWQGFDLGPYAEQFDLPENYSDYITVKYNRDKLAQMQKVSLMMADVVDEICTEQKLQYYVLGTNAFNCLFDNGIEENNLSELWQEPLLIGMPREDYERFLDTAEEKLGNRFILQHKGNTEDYYYTHAKLRLEFTELRDSRIPEDVDSKFHSGFWIDIVPMDNAPDDKTARKKQADIADRLENKLIIKWTRSNLFRFRRSKFKTKIKLIMMAGSSAKGIFDKLNTVMTSYNDGDTDYYIYPKGENRLFFTATKDTFGEGVRCDYQGHSLMFPADKAKYLKSQECKKSKHTESLAELTERVSKRYASCFLTYYDNEDYQLSVLRYDESSNKFLSNEELMGEN